MPKQTINTFSSLSFNGQNVSVNSVFCENGIISNNVSKEVVFFEKFASKKKFDAKVKSCDEMER